MPLIGQVAAADLSVSKLSSKIEGLLADGYLVDPQVNIFIEEFRSRKVTILGQVNSPGVYEIKGQTTLLELISQADGLTPDAAERAVIHRKKPGQKGSNKDEKAMQVDLARLMEEGRSSENIFVVDGDNIYIPKKEVFYVSGEVEKPDVYNYEKGLTVIKALTMAGGANEMAAPGRIKIIRIRDGKEHLIKDVKMGMKVRPNDVIVVPESYF